MSWVARMSASGSLPSNTRSARLPGATIPRSSRPKCPAGSTVGAGVGLDQFVAMVAMHASADGQPGLATKAFRESALRKGLAELGSHGLLGCSDHDKDGPLTE